MTDGIEYLGLVDEDDLLLDAAALELAALDHPGVDLGPYAALLSALTERLAELGGSARSGAQQARMLARVIGVEYGFAGDRDSYDDPDNADLIRVIDRRRGLPVSLSILYVAAARRIGWAAEALNTPGHVLVRLGPATAPVIVDPFNDGRLVAAEQLAALVARSTEEGGATVPAESVAPMPNRAVLTRLLLNQATRAEAAGDRARARTLYARMTTFAPADANAWWQRARLELVAGDVDQARGSLAALLEMVREPALRARVVEALERLGTTD